MVKLSIETSFLTFCGTSSLSYENYFNIYLNTFIHCCLDEITGISIVSFVCIY